MGLENCLNLKEVVAQGFSGGLMYCPRCREVTKMTVERRHNSQIIDAIGTKNSDKSGAFENLSPGLYHYQCVNCDELFTAVLYSSEGKPSLSVFPMHTWGSVSPNTPESVGYYLGQAYKCTAAGAYTAALSMYRAALDQLLMDQGFTRGTCGFKVGDLKKAIIDRTAPKWALKLGTDMLEIIAEIGNESMHAADDLTKLEKLTADHLVHLHLALGHLIATVYDLPNDHAQRLNSLQEAHKKAKSP